MQSWFPGEWRCVISVSGSRRWLGGHSYTRGSRNKPPTSLCVAKKNQYKLFKNSVENNKDFADIIDFLFHCISKDIILVLFE